MDRIQTLRLRRMPRGRREQMALCDDSGVLLPGQRSVTVRGSVGDPGTVVVEFVIDERAVVSELDQVAVLPGPVR